MSNGKPRSSAMLAGCDGLDDWQSPTLPSKATIALRKAGLERHNIPAADIEKLTPLVFLCRALLPELLSSTRRRQKASAPGDGEPNGVRINVRSADLPSGAGLGSSAAFSVASAAALVRLRHHLYTGSHVGLFMAISTPTWRTLSRRCDKAHHQRLGLLRGMHPSRDALWPRQ